MGFNKPDKVDTTDMSGVVQDFSVEHEDTGTIGPGEQVYQSDWTKWNGYYQSIPELTSVVDTKAFWTVGKGYTADDKTKKILDRIKGFGKDNFNTLLSNFTRTYTVNGDSFNEIIRDKAKRLLNLKPLNPGSIRIVSNAKGMLVRYEQLSSDGKKVENKWEPDEILHFAWNRIADEVHGMSTVKKIENIILMRNESMEDMKTVFHRYVKPLIISEVDTDDETELATIKSKIDNSIANSENLIIPKDTVSMSRVSIPQFSTLDPLPWIQLLQSYFILAEGVPEIVLGGGGSSSESSSKISYLAFEQMIKWNQLFLEQELEKQVGIKIKLNFPASIAPDLIKDEKKDGPNGGIDKEGTQAGKEEK